MGHSAHGVGALPHPRHLLLPRVAERQVLSRPRAHAEERLRLVLSRPRDTPRWKGLPRADLAAGCALLLLLLSLLIGPPPPRRVPTPPAHRHTPSRHACGTNHAAPTRCATRCAPTRIATHRQPHTTSPFAQSPRDSYCAGFEGCLPAVEPDVRRGGLQNIYRIFIVSTCIF